MLIVVGEVVALQLAPRVEREIVVEVASFTVDGTNYFGAYCTPAPQNRGTEFDWVAFLWNLSVDESISPEDIADIYVEARTGGDDWYDTGNGSGSGYPAYELEEAAGRVNTGFGTSWDYWSSTYGTDR
jgi:hypothetical protein